MKKYILMACAAVALMGCNKGGTGDDYGTSSGTTAPTPPARERPATTTDTNAPSTATPPSATDQSTKPQK